MTPRRPGGAVAGCMAVAALVGACGGSAKPVAVPPPVLPCGVSTWAGVPVRRFCGTGTLSIRTRSRTTTLPGAECLSAQGGMTVNGGDLVLGHPPGATRSLPYIGIDVKSLPPAPGGPTVARAAVISAVIDERIISVTDAMVTLDRTGASGSAQGAARDGSGVAVTFSC